MMRGRSERGKTSWEGLGGAIKKVRNKIKEGVGVKRGERNDEDGGKEGRGGEGGVKETSVL